MSASIEEILGEATRLEKEYEWLQASELYGQALGMVDEGDHFRRGEIQEKIGHSLHRAAFQAESLEEFREKMGLAVEAYEKAHDLYERLTDERGAPWILRCGAMSRYLSYSLTSDTSEKRRLLDECLELEENALMAFWDLGNKLEYGRTYNELPLVTRHRVLHEWDIEARKRLLEEVIALGEKAVAALSELGDLYEIARTHLILAINMSMFRFFSEDLARGTEKVIEHSRKAVEFSERVGDAYLIGQSYILFSYWSSRFGEAPIPYLEKALKYGDETRDNYLKGLALDWLAYQTYWKAFGTEDPDQRRKLSEEAMEFYDRAHHHYSLISYRLPRAGKMGDPPPGGYAEYYKDRAEWEIDPDKKLEFLEKSEKAGLEALKLAEDSDIPHSISHVSHIFSQTLAIRARTESDVDVKRSLLEKALEHRERNIEIYERIMPLHYYNIGSYHNLLAEIKAELAYIQPDLDSRRRFLEDAALSKENSFNIFRKIMPFGHLDLYSTLCRYQDGYGVILIHLYDATKTSDHLRRAIDIWRKAIESARKLDHFSRIAESYWKIAKTQDILGEHLEAAENFKQASEGYMKAAEKIPQLREFYQNYASYMLAWYEIKWADHHHAQREYGEAKEHYEKAADLHESTERWNYLAPNYQAWARLDEAEDLSRREQTQEAGDLFRQAVELFSETEDSIKSKLNTIEVGEERQIAEELIKASDSRREYCLGRAALEEARILDRQGDHLASSKRYGQSAERFQGVVDSFELESDRRELRPIVYLCRAWQKMMLAEEEMSSSLYSEAAGLFMEAREHAIDQTTRLLAQAHSSFCKALEAGTRFELTRETELFSEAKRHIEASTGYYLRAGQQTMSDYAGATSRFLDAYLYTYNAQTEVDLEKKAQFYQIAERLLQSSAGAYLKAKHPEKSDEIRRILGRVKEEREIAVSLSEVLHAPTLVSTTTSFSTPTPTHEQAVGLEKFESADIQANFIARRREVGVGEDLDLEIELVNAGKAPAQLVKVEDIVIEGFELKSYPDICRVEDSYLDMKGRTLSPLKTQELKLVLKPLAKGAFELKPRILYLDEAGKYKSHEPEPVSITVQEPGIRGWLRGPTR
ncbi:MAG: hypothetical protein NWE76_10920 [Candidatus Bathyarchaeota archaeon]|nr:hypothetical protein [Candidatus Bathyarchaeota archaeon]